MKTMNDVSLAAGDFFAVEDACRLAGVSMTCKHGTRIDRCWEGCEMPKNEPAKTCKICGDKSNDLYRVASAGVVSKPSKAGHYCLKCAEQRANDLVLRNRVCD